jgi:hypothetical protein
LDQKGVTIDCEVCDETELTAIVGWDQRSGPLGLRIEAPNGPIIDAASPGVTTKLGATWALLRVRLPYATNREGTWRITVEPVQAFERNPSLSATSSRSSSKTDLAFGRWCLPR